MVAYYVEVNLICIIVLLLFWVQNKNMKTRSTDQNMLNLLNLCTVLFCLSDMLAGIFRGRVFPGAKAILEISNLAYFELLAVISFLWNVYTHLRLGRARLYRKKQFFYSALPLLLFTAVALTNPFTHLLFSIDAANLYRRGAGIFLHWLVVWGYFLVPTVRTLRRYLQEESAIKKQELLPVLYFAAAPFVASVVQMFCYGITSTQVGITISLVMICLSYQDTQILTDALTGINNRRGLDYYLAGSLQRAGGATYTLLMIDVDSFKHINDAYGHMTGDLVLRHIADVLKGACRLVSKRLYLCRFGGDEFIIVGADCEEADIQRLKDGILRKINTGKPGQLPCAISVSIGTGVGRCANEKDWKALLAKADEAMYTIKQKKHNQDTTA